MIKGNYLDIQKKLQKEKQSFSILLAIYCEGKHHHKNGLCEQCAEMEAYAHLKSENCRFRETKTFCSKCTSHCYTPQKREAVREIMRYSGPRLIFKHPIRAVEHLIATIKP